MEVNKKYPIIGAELITTKFGPTVLMRIKEQPTKVVKVYLPKRYSAIVLDEDIELINSRKVSLNLLYKGTYEKKLLQFSVRGLYIVMFFKPYLSSQKMYPQNNMRFFLFQIFFL
jgi:hypothetical protein